MNTLIKNGTLITASETFPADILIEGETISQIAAIIALLVMDAYGEWWPWLHGLFTPWTPWFALLSLWLTVVLTATSGALYLWRNRAIYLNDM